MATTITVTITDPRDDAPTLLDFCLCEWSEGAEGWADAGNDPADLPYGDEPLILFGPVLGGSRHLVDPVGCRSWDHACILADAMAATIQNSLRTV